MNRTLKIVIVTIMLLILNSLSLLNSVRAANLGNVRIYAEKDCGQLLKYKGIIVKTTYAEYHAKDGKYPAYCLDKTLSGVGIVGDYDTNVNTLITDVKLWRYIINGYPYKSLEELGVANKYEAFSATKQAIYCCVHGNDINQYEPIGEAGNRTLNAMKKIINNANASKETQISNIITINKNLEGWKQEGTNIVKHYNIASSVGMNKYSVELKKADNDLPEGIKIVNEKNEEKSEFNANEKFKVIIPIKNIKSEGNFKIAIKGKINTKPVLYAKPYNASYQDYALTGATYEDGTGETKDTYSKNGTKIIINKKDSETGTKLQGTEFELLNDKKEIVYDKLVTNNEGKIIVNGVVPGKYYLKETKAKDGYIKTSDLMEINVKYNQEFTITVNNSKENKPKFEYTKDSQEVEIKKLPVTGM